MELPKNYDFKESEQKWIKEWEQKRLYSYKDKGTKKFSIDTPPPTVSGRMHIGHACSYTQGDIIVRYRRMKGESVFYPFGTDDNGLPTERLVESLKNVKSKSMGREEFVELCEKTIKELKPEFIADWKKVGISADFENSYSTIDAHSIKTSQKSFLDLLKKGRVFQEESPVSWCVHCQTAIAQAEFENVDITSNFNDIIFKQGSKELVIATTRPELLPACVAVFANPNDERYKELKGKFATVPLLNYEVPILFDESVALDKGTGLMMVCTFGDKEDVEKWYKYKLPLKSAITEDGKLNEEGKQYKGLTIKEARKQIIEDLKKENLLLTQKPITHPVNVHERCGTEIEILKTKQWFIKVLDKKQELLKAADQITWYPEFMKKRYIHWVENLQWDWCISRQRFFGVPFPIWYSKKTGEVIPASDEQLPVDPLKDKPKVLPPNHTYADIISESDVMDTWATSSVTPQIALDWADHPEKFKEMFPETVRLQAHDIIRTWAFYTIVKGIYNNNAVPWKNIIISGFVLDPKGQKMSKSKKNTIAPQIILEEFGADALRYWAAGSKLGEDLPYQEKDVLTGKKTVTKLWNASKFTLMNLEGYNPIQTSASSQGGTQTPEIQNTDSLEVMDKWLLSKLMKIIKVSTESFENYEYSKAKHETDVFFWQTFCDNYLEFTKYRTYGEDKQPTEHGTQNNTKLAAQKTLYYALLTQLKLFAPILPFITEEIYNMYFKEIEKEESIHTSSWPEINSKLIDEESEKAGDLAVQINSEARKYKSEKKLSLKTEITTLKIKCTAEQKELIQKTIKDLKATGNIKEIFFEKGETLELLFS
ncbi:valine--tRNA ligase [Candidatus Woesearchaeota archaeon CG10_big_fil_rev_8_21_14_0_10_32_9]|nr:MAG: valine--tRNA ligase [Candidatus Woesearchaeota archaeon CG10_big_fil_rev_8_21_14_0_10_32_9]